MLYCRLNETLRHNCMFPNLLWSILGFRGIYLNISSINVKFQGGSHHTQWGFKSKVIKINQRLFHVSVYPLAFTPLRRWSQVRRTSQKRRLFNFSTKSHKLRSVDSGGALKGTCRTWRWKSKENVDRWSSFEFSLNSLTFGWTVEDEISKNSLQNFCQLFN